MPTTAEIQVKITPLQSSIEETSKRLATSLENALGKSGLGGIGKSIGGAVKGAGSGIGGALGGLSGITKMAASLGIIVALIQSSVALQKTIQGFLKLIEMILRPFGDLIAALLRPVLWGCCL